MFKYIGLIVVLLVVFASIATAAQVILNPSDDAAVIEYDPYGNYGSNIYSWIGRNYNGWLITLIRFDLSSYSGVIVESAYLRLYVEGSYGTFPPDNTFIGMCDAYWDESTVTWNTRPGVVYWNYITAPSSTGAWWTIDVTGYVADWVGGTYNYGFKLGTIDYDDDYFNVLTKEWLDQYYIPELELNYHYASIQSTSLGNIKSLFE